jgi:nitric oxide dioxygenase
LVASRTGIRNVTLYETVASDDVPDEHYDAVGRITAEVIRRHLPEGHAEFYYCGPIGFMAAAERALDELGVPSTHRHSEAFAPDPSFTDGMPHSNPLVEAA